MANDRVGRLTRSSSGTGGRDGGLMSLAFLGRGRTHTPDGNRNGIHRSLDRIFPIYTRKYPPLSTAEHIRGTTSFPSSRCKKKNKTQLILAARSKRVLRLHAYASVRSSALSIIERALPVSATEAIPTRNHYSSTLHREACTLHHRSNYRSQKTRSGSAAITKLKNDNQRYTHTSEA